LVVAVHRRHPGKLREVPFGRFPDPPAGRPHFHAGQSRSYHFGFCWEGRLHVIASINDLHISISQKWRSFGSCVINYSLTERYIARRAR
jgi:hypothetical protein